MNDKKDYVVEVDEEYYDESFVAERDLRCDETKSNKLIYKIVNGKVDSVVSPIRSIRNKIDPKTGLKWKIIQHREKRKVLKNRRNA